MLEQQNNNLQKCINELPELYQPIFNHPEYSLKTSRTCIDRFENIKQIYLLIEKYFGRPLRVLDLGCAQGFFSLSLSSLGAKVKGIDFLDKNIAVCNELVSENSLLKIQFEVNRVENVIGGLDTDEYDLVLGLSVFHHIIYEHGFENTKLLLHQLAQKIPFSIFEVALKEEPLYWGPSQPNEPRLFLENYAFVHELATHSTHLSNIVRPLYVASNQYWIIDNSVERFNYYKSVSHQLAGEVHQSTRRYFFSEYNILKLYLLNNQNLIEANTREFKNEIFYLKDESLKIPFKPKLLTYGKNQSELWLVREKLHGELLLNFIEKNLPYEHEDIVLQILDQLIILEENKMYHNDLRTWNILINSNGVATLIDYGAISHNALDYAWPYNRFLAFAIFIKEVSERKILNPADVRYASLNFEMMSDPWKSIFIQFFNLNEKELSFLNFKKIFLEHTKNSDSPAHNTLMDKAIEDILNLTHHANARATQAEQNASEANERATQAEQKANEASERATQAEQNASEANERATQAEQKANEASERVTQAEQKANEASERVTQAEQKANEASERVTQAEQKANEASERVTQAEQHIELLLNSNSWKITKPLRLLSGFVGYFLRGVYSWISFAPGSRPRRVLVKLINLVKNKNKYMEKEVYGCVITKNKPSILVDMYVLGQGVKTGVYRVCDEIYKRLVLSKEFNINYYVNENFAEESKRYIKDSKYPCFDKSYNYNDVKNKIDFFLAPFGVAPAEIISNDNIKHIHIVYDLIAIHNPEYFSVEGALEVKKIIDSLSDKTIIFAISENTKKDLLKYRSDFNEEQITVIPLAADSKFSPCLDENIKKSVHTKYNIPENPYILSLATLEVRKNMDKVVESFSVFIQNNPQSRHNLVLSGMIGWKLEKLQNKLKEKKELLGRVILTGFVDDIDLPALYSGADCFVYLSKYEGFGLPPLEAMACGTPVITSNNSSLPEVIGDAGLMFDCDDINSIANAMKKITSDPCYRDKLSKKGLIQAKKFNWDTAVSIILERLKKEYYNG